MRALILMLALLCGCSRVIYPGNGQHVSVSALGSWSQAELQDLGAACAMWDAAGVHLRVNDGGTGYDIPTHFDYFPWWVEDQNDVGVYVDDLGEVWCSPRYVTAGPGGLKQCLAHELGHAIGLNHVKRGIMQPSLSNYDELQPDDYAEHARVWP